MIRIRAAVADLPAYRAGKPAGLAPGVRAAYKVSSNESPQAPGATVRDAMGAAAARANRYPDFASTELVAALAERHGVPAESIAMGAGSVEVLQQALLTVVQPGTVDRVVYAWRSFEAYPILVSVASGRGVPVPLDVTAGHDLVAMAAAVDDATAAVLLCSPNNPTGPALRRDQVEAFLAAVPTDVLVILDEAYAEYTDGTDAVDGVDLVRSGRWPNLLVTRTFSKAYGLAGLRVGYGVASDPTVAGLLRACALPFGVSGPAQAAAVAALQDATALAATVQSAIELRADTVARLRTLGLDVPAAAGNFVWLPLGEDAASFAEHVARTGPVALSVRAFPGEGVRVTIAEPEAATALVTHVEAWTSRLVG